MSEVRRTVCFVVPLVLCLVALTAAAQASQSSSTGVPSSLRAQILRLGVTCSQQRAARNHQDCYMGSKAQQKRFAQLYPKAANVCRSLRPSASDGRVGTVSVAHHTQNTSFVCRWGRKDSARRIEVLIDLPNPGQSLAGQACDSYAGTICVQLAEGIQITRPYQTVDRYGYVMVVSSRGYVAVTRWAVTHTAFNARLANDLSMFNRIAFALGLPRAGE